MSERERWIVYPLLFLALGVSLRDQMFDRTWSKDIICEELVMLQDDTNPLRQRLVGSISPSGEPLYDATPIGHMYIGTVHARTVVADQYLSNAQVKRGSALLEFLKSLRLSPLGAQAPQVQPVPEQVPEKLPAEQGEAEPAESESIENGSEGESG